MKNFTFTRTLVLTALLLTLLPKLHAQGFRMFSGRNHPEQKWEQHITEHFTIILPKHLHYLAPEAATVAEQTYSSLSKSTKVEFKNKIRIYLSDEDEIANGFAVPFGGGTTNIWVNVNESAAIWTGEVKWIRKVLAHELAHIFHFEITKSNIGLWGNLFGEAMPRFWSEGWAQYSTERWDSERGDRWLRTAVFDDQLSYNNPNTLDNGRMVYAVGNSQVRFFHEKFGDSTFVKISNFRDTTFRFIRHNDFYKGFKKSTGMTYSAFRDSWRKHMNIYYNSLAAEMQRTDSLLSKAEQPTGRFIDLARRKPGSDTLAILGYPSVEVPAKELVLAWKKSDKWKSKRLAEGAIGDGFSWSPNGKKIAFSRNGPVQNGSLVNDIFIVDIKTGREQRITNNARASYPAWLSNDDLVFVQTIGNTSNLIQKTISSGKETPISAFSGDTQLLFTEAHPSTQKIAVSTFEADGKRRIALFEPNSDVPTYLGNGINDNRNVRFSDDGKILFYESLRDNVPNIFSYDLESGNETRITNQFAGARLFDLSENGSELIAGVTETRSDDYMYSIPIKPYIKSVAPVSDAYTNWMKVKPTRTIPYFTVADSSLIKSTTAYSSFKNVDHLFSFAIPDYNTEVGFNLTGFTTWVDLLAHHFITAIGNWTPQQAEQSPFYLISYQNNMFRPTLLFNLFKVPSVGQFYGGAYILDELNGAEFQISLPVDLLHRPFSSSAVQFRVRSAGFNPIKLQIYDDPIEQNGFAPQVLRQTDFLLAYKWSKKRPVRSSIHPLNAHGFRFQVAGGTKNLGGETEFIRPEMHGFVNIPTFYNQTIFVQARGVFQSGESLAQDFVGFSRYDNVQLDLPANSSVLFLATADRVRGHRTFLIGDKTAFLSAEYRIPILKRMETKILGIFEFGELTVSAFADAGYVGGLKNIPGESDRSLTGYGYEFKNAFMIGALQISHAVGVGYSSGKFETANADWHYRIKTTLPF